MADTNIQDFDEIEKILDTPLDIARHKTFFELELKGKATNIKTTRILGGHGLVLDITIGDSITCKNHMFFATSCNYAMYAFDQATNGHGIHPFSFMFFEELDQKEDQKENQDQDFWSNIMLVPNNDSTIDLIKQITRQKFLELDNQDLADRYRAHYFCALDRVAITCEFNK